MYCFLLILIFCSFFIIISTADYNYYSWLMELENSWKLDECVSRRIDILNIERCLPIHCPYYRNHIW